MKTIIRRIILLLLLIIPITMLAVSFNHSPPDEGLELAFLVIGVPILVLNAWEWMLPKKGEQK